MSYKRKDWNPDFVNTSKKSPTRNREYKTYIFLRNFSKNFKRMTPKSCKNTNTSILKSHPVKFSINFFSQPVSKKDHRDSEYSNLINSSAFAQLVDRTQNSLLAIFNLRREFALYRHTPGKSHSFVSVSHGIL